MHVCANCCFTVIRVNQNIIITFTPQVKALSMYACVTQFNGLLYSTGTYVVMAFVAAIVI